MLLFAGRVCLQLNTHLGTALMNAYKSVPTLGCHATTITVAARADHLLARLARTGHATGQTYALAAAVHAQVRCAGWGRDWECEAGQGIRQV